MGTETKGVKKYALCWIEMEDKSPEWGRKPIFSFGWIRYFSGMEDKSPEWGRKPVLHNFKKVWIFSMEDKSPEWGRKQFSHK